MVAVLFLAVGIFRRPWLTTQALAVSTLQVEFGDGCAVVLLLGREHLDGEVAALLGSGEAEGLPSVAGFCGGGGDGCGGVEVGLVADIVVFVALLQLQLVQFRFGLAPDDSLAGSHHVEHDDLVLALLQPAARHVECLLRTDAPDAAHGVAVDPHLALAPRLEIEERVAHLREVEVAAIVAALTHQVEAAFVPLSGQAEADTRVGLSQVVIVLKRVDGLAVVVAHGVFRPTQRLPCRFHVVHFSGDGHIAHDALEVLDGAAEVDAAHRLHQNFQFVTLPHRQQRQALLVFHTVYLSDVFAIDEDLSEVVEIGCQHTPPVDFGQTGHIEHRAPAHVHLFEGHDAALLAHRQLQIGVFAVEH